MPEWRVTKTSNREDGVERDVVNDLLELSPRVYYDYGIR